MTSPTPHCDSFKLSYKLLLIIKTTKLLSCVEFCEPPKRCKNDDAQYSLSESVVSPTHRKHEKRETPKELLGCDVQH